MNILVCIQILTTSVENIFNPVELRQTSGFHSIYNSILIRLIRDGRVYMCYIYLYHPQLSSTVIWIDLLVFVADILLGQEDVRVR